MEFNRNVGNREIGKNPPQGSRLFGPGMRWRHAEKVLQLSQNIARADKTYWMLDMKGTTAKRFLTDIFCWNYKDNEADLTTIEENIIKPGIMSIPLSSSKKPNENPESWVHAPKLMRRASSVDLPTFISHPTFSLLPDSSLL